MPVKLDIIIENTILKGQQMKKLLIGLSALLVLFLCGCASKVPMATSSEESIAKSFKKDKKYANVYLCRNTFGGSALNITVLVDGKFAGRTSGYSFFHWKMKPGKHIIQSKLETTSSLTLNTKSNTNYFIIQELGSTVGKTKLYTVDEVKGKKCVLSTKMLKSQLHVSSYPQQVNKIKPTYVSPVKYENYSCRQLSKEIEKISQRAAIVSGQLENIDTQNAAKIFMSPLIFLPAALSSESEKEKIELRKLNGEYNALKTVAKQKKCKFVPSL